jgi:hypothetical protein
MSATLSLATVTVDILKEQWRWIRRGKPCGSAKVKQA